MKEYQLDDDEVLQAISLVIEDTTRKYDEILVERFLDSIRQRLKEDILIKQSWDEAVKPLRDKFKFFISHKELERFNQRRLLKLCAVMIRESSDFLEVIPLLDILWTKWSVIIADKSLSTTNVMLSIIVDLISQSDQGFKNIMERKIEPSLNLTTKTSADDVLNLSRYFVETGNDQIYSTARKVITLTIRKMLSHLPDGLPELITDSFYTNSRGMIDLFNSLVCEDKNNPISAYRDIAQKSFDSVLHHHNANIDKITEFLALTNSSNNFEIELDKLRSYKKLRGAIIYLSKSKYQGEEAVSSLLSYLLYPLLSTFHNEDNRLLISKKDMDFINDNMSDKLVILCLTQITSIFCENKDRISNANLLLTAQTLIKYIKHHYGELKNLKNTMECCKILYLLHSSDKMDEHSSRILEDLHDLLDSIQCSSNETEPVLLSLLDLLSRVHEKYSHSDCGKELHKNWWLKTIDLANKFHDHDTINAFAEFFLTNEFPLNLTADDQKKYVELVWYHMYLKSEDAANRELPANLRRLLFHIKSRTHASVLEAIDLPKQFAEALEIEREMTDRAPSPPCGECMVDSLFMVVDDIINYELKWDGVLDCH